MISEEPSKELTEVYRTRGTQIGAKGEEDHAPDQTHSSDLGKLPKIDESEKASHGAEHADEVERMKAQEKGEKVGSGDTTATPASMVYDPKSDSSSSTPNSLSSSSSSDTATKTASKGARHPSLLLTLAQIPVLQRTFDLRPAEIMDITRAVEQADLRANAVDRRNGMGSDAAEKK